MSQAFVFKSWRSSWKEGSLLLGTYFQEEESKITTDHRRFTNDWQLSVPQFHHLHDGLDNNRYRQQQLIGVRAKCFAFNKKSSVNTSRSHCCCRPFCYWSVLLSSKGRPLQGEAEPSPQWEKKRDSVNQTREEQEQSQEARMALAFPETGGQGGPSNKKGQSQTGRNNEKLESTSFMWWESTEKF